MLRSDGRWQVSLRYLDPATNAHKRAYLYGNTRPDAVAKRRALGRRLRSGLAATDSLMTVKHWCSQWLEDFVATSPRTESTKLKYERLLRVHVYETKLGATPLARLTPQLIEAWLLELRTRPNPRSEATHLAVFSVLKTSFDTAVRELLLERNPAATVPPPRSSTGEKVVPTEAELMRVLAQTSGTILHNTWLLICATGMRKGECLALQWNDIDFEKGTVTVRKTVSEFKGGYGVKEPKTRGSWRVLYLEQGTLAVLGRQHTRVAQMRLQAREEWREGNWVFPTPLGERHHPRSALRAFQSAARRAGVARKIDVHSLRRFATTTMLIGGADVTAVSKILGHADSRVTADVYAHMTDESRDRAMQVLGDTMRVLTAPTTWNPSSQRPSDRDDPREADDVKPLHS